MKTKNLLFSALLVLCFALSANAQTYNYYYGTLHSHTANSDGQGTLDQAYSYAKNTAGLDFFAITDHDNYPNAMTAAEFTATKTTADTYNQAGTFTAFWGYEWGSGSIEGEELCIIGTTNFMTSTNTLYNNWDKIGAWIDTQDCVAFFNHPGYGKAGGSPARTNNYARTVRNNIVGMELFNKTVGFATYYYNNGEIVGDGKNYFNEALSAGWKIGGMGGNDNHTANWGTNSNFRMAIIAPANTRTDLMDAMKARRFYSTLDKNLRLSFKIIGNEMGSTLPTGSNLTVSINASDPDNENFTQVQLLKNGTVVSTWTPNSTNPALTYNITSAANNDYYYVLVKQSDNDEACSSPIWFSSAASTVAVTSVSISQGSATLNTGNTLQLTASVLPTNATNKLITWSSSNTGAATVDAKGLVTPVAAGSTNIIATSAADGTKKATCVLTVTATVVPVSSVSVSPTTATLTVGGSTQQLTPTVLPANATNKAVTYLSNNNAVASVNASGLITPVGVGTTTVTVTSAADGTKTAACNVTVNAGGCTGNLVTNSGFETDMTGWVNFTGIPGGWAGVTPAVRSTAQKANGVASASIASQWGGCVQKVITGITAGKSYKLDMNIMAPVATASQIVDLGFYNASNVKLATYPISTTSTSFSPYSVTGVAPIGTAYALVEIYSDYSGFFIDDICLTQVVGTGVNSSKSDALQIYPSLVSDLLNIKLENQNSATISIYNTTGQEMYKQQSNEVATGISLNLNNLNFKQGIYLVKAQAGNSTYLSKFVKK